MKHKEWNVLTYAKGEMPPIPFKISPTYTIYQEGLGDVAYIQHTWDEDQVIQNTNLIRYAPDLLACLENAVKCLKWAADVIQDIPAGSEYAHTLREARVAINRAKRKEI